MTQRATIGTATVLIVLLASSLAAPGSAERPTVPPIAHAGSLHRPDVALPTPPRDLSPERFADWLIEQAPVIGETPRAWIDWAQGLARSPAAGASAGAADLPTEVARIYAATGTALSATARAAIARGAASVPGAVRAPFADLVATVADALVVQNAIAARVEARARAGLDAPAALLGIAERDVMRASAARILGALDGFRRATSDAFAAMGATVPIFSDPEGLVILGGTGDDHYERDGAVLDPVLLIDPDGADLYENSAGGACPVTIDVAFGGQWMECNSLALSVVADLGIDSDDTYRYDGAPAAIQGAGGPGGLGILLDVGGDDRYEARMTRAETGAWGPTLYFDGGAQGFGYAGLGVLVDATGNDTYDFAVRSTRGRSIWAFGQGFGGAGGLGLAHDASGADEWITAGTGLGRPSNGFVGVYTNGTGFYGGVGLMLDTGLGDDRYDSRVVAQSVDYYALGFGAFGGVGILFDDGGNDDYVTYEEGIGPLVIDPILNCAFGTASFGGVGIMIDGGGDDSYYGGTVGPGGATVMNFGFGGPGAAYGAFVDLGGDDVYTMEAIGSRTFVTGHGLLAPEHGIGDGANILGTFVDIGGDDSYSMDGVGNDSQWAFGMDRGT